jgi:hypothetical protein
MQDLLIASLTAAYTLLIKRMTRAKPMANIGMVRMRKKEVSKLGRIEQATGPCVRAAVPTKSVQEKASRKS